MYIKQTNSTNRLLKDSLPQEDGFFIATDYQTEGRGQAGNHWESEEGMNIIVSVLIRPQQLKANKQFRLSMLTSLSVVETLEEILPEYEWCIKWPNDIYYKDKKLGGILIENRLSEGNVSDCIFGLGLNVNQTHFESDAPNPISLKQITGQTVDRGDILNGILKRLKEQKRLEDGYYKELKETYIRHLYRKDGFFEYEDEGGRLTARFKDIDKDGRLVLETEQGEEKAYLFKQVRYII